MKDPSKKLIESKEEIEKILRKGTMGFLGMSKDDRPYVIPMTYAYDDGRILFHCALNNGMKIEYLKANPQVSFTVGRQSGKIIRHPCGASCKSSHDSVVCFGTARIIDDVNDRLRVLNTFNQVLQSGARTVTEKDASNCYAIEITINRMSCRSQRRGLDFTYFEYAFN